MGDRWAALEPVRQGVRAHLGPRRRYVGEPECNGVAERFIRTLKEERIYLNDFETLEEAREVIGAFIERYNNGWLLQRASPGDTLLSGRTPGPG